MHDETKLDLSFTAAQRGLAGLANGAWLLDASQAAYGEGITGLARVGPVRGLSRLVKLDMRDPVVHRDSARLALRWEATGAGSSLFPALDADIVLSPVGEQATKLALDGVYRPPLGALGAGLDHAVLSRVATATIRDFVTRVAKAISTAPAASEPAYQPLGQDTAAEPPEPLQR